MLGGRDADGAGGFLAKFAQGRDLRLDLLESRAQGAEQAFARFRRGDAARGAGQQPDAEPRFELADGVAQRGLRDAELRCRLGEAALSRHGEEGEEVVEMSARAFMILLISLCGL